MFHIFPFDQIVVQQFSFFDRDISFWALLRDSAVDDVLCSWLLWDVTLVIVNLFLRQILLEVAAWLFLEPWLMGIQRKQ